MACTIWDLRSGHFVFATRGETAASNCISPSTAKSGAFFLVFSAVNFSGCMAETVFRLYALIKNVKKCL